jgi:Tfp pilus assembly protein PilV
MLRKHGRESLSIHGIAFDNHLINASDMKYSNLQGFTFFETLLSWSLFVIAMTGVAFAQMSALKSLRYAYLNETAVIQMLNIKNRFIALQDNSLRNQTYAQWHRNNSDLFYNAKDDYTCQFKSCCVSLSFSKHMLHSCFDAN